MGIFSSKSSDTAAVANELTGIAKLKKGKSPEQIRIIDFFTKEESGGCLKSSDSLYTMDEYQQLVSKKLRDLKLRSKAIEKIGLDESQIQEIEPICLASYVYRSGIFDHNALIKIDDKAAVSNQFSVTWIFFSNLQLFAYQYIFDMVSNCTRETIHEVFYSDITSLSTSRSVDEKISSSITSGCLKKTKENISRSVFVADSLEIIVPEATYSFSMKNSAEVERSLQAVKAMVREKKYSM